MATLCFARSEMPTMEDLPLVTAYYADSDGEEWPDAGSHESFVGERTMLGSAPTMVAVLL